MFEELADPTPPTPGHGERQAVAAKAARLARRRRAYVASGGGVVAIALLAVSGVLSPGSRSAGLTTEPPAAGPTPSAVTVPAPSTQPPAEPSIRPSPSPSPLLSSAPVATTHPAPSPTSASPSQAPPTPSPEPTYAGPPDGSPPERRSWSTGFTACAVTDPEASTAPGPGLTLRLDLPKSVYAPGERIEGTLVVRNDSGKPASFWVSRPNEDDGTLVASSGWAASARTGTDAIGNAEYEVAPGESVRLAAAIRTDTCGSEAGSYEPLPEGGYDAMAELVWRNGDDAGHWWSPLVPVTLTA